MRNNMNRSSILMLSILHLVMLVASKAYPPSTNNSDKHPARIIDTHCHYVPTFYRDLLNSINATAGGLQIPDWNASEHLALNAQFGIITSVVSVSTPGAKLSADAPIEQGRTLARQINEYGFNLTVDYPGRFKFYATLTLPDLEGAVAEAIYALDTLGAAGVIIQASSYGELLGTRRYDPLYKVLDDRKAVLFVHPSSSPCPGNEVDFPPYVVDFLLDTTRAALDLVYRNVTTDYPNIKILLAHSGGFIPFAATRAAGSLALYANFLTSQALSGVYIDKLKQLNVELAASANIYALPSTTTFFDKEHIAYGSDFPYAPFWFINENNEGYISHPFSSKTRERIDYENADALFGQRLKTSP